MSRRNENTSISFCIRGDTLRKAEVTSLLGIKPTWAWDQGEPYDCCVKVGDNDDGSARFRWLERFRHWGVWVTSTEEFVDNDEIDPHAEHLLAKLEPVADKIRKFVSNPAYFVIVKVWYVGGSGFSIRADYMARLASLCETVDVSCWESAEA